VADAAPVSHPADSAVAGGRLPGLWQAAVRAAVTRRRTTDSQSLVPAAPRPDGLPDSQRGGQVLITKWQQY